MCYALVLVGLLKLASLTSAGTSSPERISKFVGGLNLLDSKDAA